MGNKKPRVIELRTLSLVVERTFDVAAAVENAFDQHRFIRHHEGNRNAPLESDRAQAGSKSSRWFPRSGNVVRPKQNATMRVM
jgi:hypothetical protein